MRSNEHALNEEKKRVEHIREAAEVLGISERTVYRRLRSGRIGSLPVGKSTDNDMPSVNVEKSGDTHSALNHYNSELLVAVAARVDALADMTNDNLLTIRQAIAAKDEQITALLEHQKELTVTLQNLQAQMCELAKLALSQNVPNEKTSLPQPVLPQEPVAPTKITIWDRLRRSTR